MRALLGQHPDEDPMPLAFVFCPDCAQREFGDADRRADLEE